MSAIYCETAGHTWRRDQKECVMCGAVNEEKRTDKLSQQREAFAEMRQVRSADEAMLADVFGPGSVEHSGYRSKHHCPTCGRVFDACSCKPVSHTRLEEVASGRRLPTATDGQAMARELLQVRGERTNEAHKAQLAQAKASVAQSLATQFRCKVARVQFHPGAGSATLENFFDDLAGNAVSGIMELICRESAEEE